MLLEDSLCNLPVTLVVLLLDSFADTCPPAEVTFGLAETVFFITGYFGSVHVFVHAVRLAPFFESVCILRYIPYREIRARKIPPWKV